MAQRDRAAIGVDLLQVDVQLLGPCQHHRGEGLVDLDNVDIVHRQAGLGERVLGGGDGAGQHEHWVVAAGADVMNACTWLQPVCLHCAFRGDQRRATTVGDLAGQRGRETTTLDEGLEPGHLLQRALARTLVDAEVADRDDLIVEVSVADRGKGPLVAGECELLHLLAADVPLLGDHLRTAELGDFLIAIAVQPALGFCCGRSESVLLADEHRGRDRNLAHVLEATGHHQVGGTGHNSLRGKGNGLLARSALTVDGAARHLFRVTAGQPREASGIAGLPADGVQDSHDHVIDGVGVDVDAVEKPLEGGRTQIQRVHRGQ